ncbi:hypothetical protein LTR46_001815 [Exophiala xenobiotica]|nr:hypothetical protein LTR46_001815 [Exophiala xenobiotica]
MAPQNDEERPLLRSDDDPEVDSQYSRTTQKVQFDDDDEENPRAWSGRKKIVNVAIIALMAILSPLASSMFTPGISQIAKDLNTSEQSVIATTTGFVIMLGFGPLSMAPLSETFGRRNYVLLMWAGVMLVIITIFVPETLDLKILPE